MSNNVVWALATIVAGVLITGSAVAAEPMSLADALRRAADSHPDLQGFAAERAGHDAHRSFAGRGPTTEISVLLEDALGSGDRKGLRTAQWTLSFSQALEIAGQRGARLSLEDARGAELLAQQDQRRLDAMAEVAQRFIEAAAEAQRHELAESEVDVAQKAFDAARKRVDAARAPVAERARAQAELAKAVLAREHAEHEEQSARLALAVSLGQSQPDFGELRASLYALPKLRPLEALRERLEQSPAAQARVAAAAVHEQERRAALAAAGLRPTLTGGVRRYEQGDDVGFVLGLSIPVGAGSKARDEANIAAARLSQSEAENRGALLRAEELLFDRYQELQHAREALRMLEADVLPAMDEALRQTQYAYDRGRYGYLELSQISHERAASQLERIDTAARYHSLLAELERLTGDNLIDRSNP